MVIINFDTHGTWDANLFAGPAIHAPAAVRNIIVIDYVVQWLDISDPEANFFAKNHGRYCGL